MKKSYRVYLIEILSKWKSGEYYEKQVHELAEKLLGSLNEIPNYPNYNYYSIEIEVILNLDVLNYQLITVEDVDSMLEFLYTKKGDELESWKKWGDYMDSIDWEKRKRELKDNEYYLT